VIGIGTKSDVRRVDDKDAETTTKKQKKSREKMGVETINKEIIRYSQCWEDADTLIEHIHVATDQTVLSIASAGDNTLSLLAQGPKAVIAVDLSSAQLALLELKAQCFRSLTYGELLYFLGVKDVCNGTRDRLAIYSSMRMALSQRARLYFDQRPQAIIQGVIADGKLERYFTLFRQYVLPMVKGRALIAELLQPKTRNQRADFYRKKWGTLLYDVLFQLFFSRFSMALLGREKCFFTYAKGGLSRSLLQASKTALIEQEPANNPYLCWILTGNYGPLLPHYLRRENFEAIKANLGALVLKQGNLNEVVRDLPEGSIDAFNLSDVFEYLSPNQSATLAKLIVKASRAGGRMVYWNMLVDRTTAAYCPEDLEIEENFSTSLAAITKTFFYKRFLVERVCK
jgi:S-adenosylmethionine-diacylglycerol 3-amino-3-carboxypropyl transferase